jgi:hypothetical protein
MRPTLCLLLLLLLPSTYGAIPVTAPTDKNNAVSTTTTLTVGPDPAAATTAATLDGLPFPLATAMVVNTYGYHELLAESRTAGGVLVDSVQRRFNIVDPTRLNTENGIPPHTPYRIVNDAPSAFAGTTLQVLAPAVWTKDLPIPLAFRLVKNVAPAGQPEVLEGVRLNGLVTASNFPGVAAQLRRGWGSVQATARSTAGTADFNAECNGVATTAPVQIEASTTWLNVPVSVTSTVTYPPNSRLFITANTTIDPGVTFTVGAGSIVKCAAGATITVRGIASLEGTVANPIVFTPAVPAQPWGGFHLNNGTSSRVFAYATLFVRSGSNQTWFSGATGTGFSSHRKEQATFAVGPTNGAMLTLQDCALFDLAGVAFAGQNATFNLTRTLVQRAVSGGELNGTSSAGSTVNIDRCALLEFPTESPTFVDGDNDGIYLTGGTHNVTRSVIGWGKDDGIDSGGDGAAGTVTTLAGNWYDSIFHEGNSLSGNRTVNFSDCVFFNCGQGVEAGYSGGGGAPLATVTNSLFVANQVGLRYGDNYNSMAYTGTTLTARGNISIRNFYQDVWGYDWVSWTYNTAKMTIGDTSPAHNQPADRNLFTAANARHPDNDVLNPATDGARLAPFMPVPDSNVGVAVLTWNPMDVPANYPGSFFVRLSTFSSRTVTVSYLLNGQIGSGEETSLASGTLTFTPGETIKQVVAPILGAGPASYSRLHIALRDPVAAEVTGEVAYFATPAAVPPLTLVAAGTTGWRYRETRSEPPADWRTLAFDDSSAAATEWLPATLPAGFGTFAGVTIATAVTPGSSSDRTRAFYFRKKFTVDDPAQITSLTLRLRRDDGAVVWLNDDAIATPSVISFDGTGPWVAPFPYASNLAPNATVFTFISYSIPVSKLVKGQNILAIQVVQSSVTSSDLLLDCDLVAPLAPLELKSQWSGGRPLLWWFDSTAILERSLNLHDWFPAPVTGSPVSVQPNGAAEYFRLRR